MPRTSIRLTLPVVLATALVLTAGARFFGPPSITVSEVSGTPPTPGAVLAVVATHHTDEEKPQVSARAEAMQGGKRVSQPVALTASSKRGLYGVTKQWETGTPWVLVFTIVQGDHGDHGTAEALVRVDARGKFVGMESLIDKTNTQYRLPRKATEKEIAEALKSMQ